MTGGNRIGRWWMAGALFAVLLAGFFWRVVLMRGMLFLGDITFFYYPVFAYATRALRAGVIPLWCPELEGGMPFLGFWEGTFLYLPDAIFRWLPHAWIGFNVSILFHYLLAGLGILAYGRGIGLGPAGALAAALVYTLNGFMVMHLEHVNLIVGVAWMPWLFLAAERLWTRPRAGAVAFMAGIVAMQLFGGHPDAFLMSAFAVGLYALLHPEHGLLYQRGIRSGLLTAALPVIAYGLGVALSAAQLLPTLVLAASSWTRSHEHFTALQAASLGDAEYWHLLLPDLLGRAGDDTYFGPGGHWERCGYAGVFALALALVGLAGRHRLTKFWSLCALLGLLFATGPRSSLFHALQQLPAFGTTRLPSRWLFLFDFGVAMLAGAGLEFLTRAGASGQGRCRLRGPALGMTALSLGIGASLTWHLLIRHDWLAAAQREIARAHGTHAFVAEHWMKVYSQRLNGEAVGLGLLILAANGLIWARLRSPARMVWLGPLALVILYLDLFHFGSDYNPVFPGAEIEAIPKTAALIQQDAGTPVGTRLTRANSHRFQLFTIQHRGFWPDYGSVEDRQAFLEMLPGNWHLLVGLSSFRQNDTALRVRSWRQLRSALYLNGQTPERQLMLESRLWRWWNVGYVVSWHPLTLPGLTPLRPASPFLYRVSGNEGRAYFRSRALRFHREKSLYDCLIKTPQVLADHVLLSSEGGRAQPPPSGNAREIGGRTTTRGRWHREETDRQPRRAPAARALAAESLPVLESEALQTGGPRITGTARVLHDDPHSLELEVAAPSPGYVVLTETFYPGWQARLDGRAVATLRANGVYRAVATPAGRHRVLFTYEPAEVRLGFFLSLLATAVAAGMAAYPGVSIFKRRGVKR